MKKILKNFLIIIIVFSLAFLMTGCGNNDNGNTNEINNNNNNFESKTYSIFNKVFSNGEYLLSFELETNIETGLEKGITTMAAKNGNIYTDIDSTSQHVTVIYKDNTTYIISHNDKMYAAEEGIDENSVYDTALMNEEELQALKTKEYKTGKEQIDGTEYEYEEYKENDGTTSRYYFSGNDLVYIKSIEDEEENIMKVIKMSSKVEDDIFNIPNNYQKIDASQLQ